MLDDMRHHGLFDSRINGLAPFVVIVSAAELSFFPAGVYICHLDQKG